MTEKSPDRDSTIEDIYRTRRRIAEKFGGDLKAILEDAKKRQAASGRAIWRPKAKRQSTNVPPTSYRHAPVSVFRRPVASRPGSAVIRSSPFARPSGVLLFQRVAAKGEGLR